MNKVVMYSKDYCPYCARAKALLEQRGVADLETVSYTHLTLPTKA